MNELQGVARIRIHPGKLSIPGEVCGTPSPKLIKAVAGSDVRIYSAYLSM